MDDIVIPRKLYFAYGSNLNKEQMAMRCPDAKPLGTFLLNGWRLVFRGVADIEQWDDGILPVGVWSITDDCEDALDIYEGFPRLYGKKRFTIKGKWHMTYMMNHNHIAPPSKTYADVIREGYADFGLDARFLDDAIQHSYKMTDDPRLL